MLAYNEHIESINNQERKHDTSSLDRYVQDQKVLWHAKQYENRMFDLMMDGPNKDIPGYAYTARELAKTYRKEFIRQYIDRQYIMKMQRLQAFTEQNRLRSLGQTV